jgi:ankyrin repeat protein
MNVEMIQARLERETRLARGGGLAQIVASGAVDSYSQAVANTGSVGSSSEADSADRLYKAERRALAAVSAGDFEKMEAAVDDDKIDVNTADEHGNTLLILAAQQGNKRMVKFLLRRGANMNAQNFAGNSALHYANAYNHQDLASYLETKGCDSTMLNAAGLTCYEGLRQEDVNEL